MEQTTGKHQDLVRSGEQADFIRRLVETNESAMQQKITGFFRAIPSLMEVWSDPRANVFRRDRYDLLCSRTSTRR